MSWLKDAYQKRIEDAFWKAPNLGVGYAFDEIGLILAELEERISRLEEKNETHR